MTISVVIVDDEALAREGLALRISQHQQFAVFAKCSNGIDALEAIDTHRPDVVFVDIEMPGCSGLELVAQLKETNCEPVPKIIFITAYQEFALDAFECEAFDYLLKPYSDERLASCLAKLQQALSDRDALCKQQHLSVLLSKKVGKSLDGFIESLEHQHGLDGTDNMLSLKSGCEWLRLTLNDILWIEAAGDYMYIHTEQGNHIVRVTLKELEQVLHASAFPRVNRSAIINLAKVTRLMPNSNGEYFAQLTNGEEVKISRKYKIKLEDLICKLQ